MSSNRHLDPDPWPIYHAVRDRLISLLTSLDPDDRERTVPITAGWTVREVASHVAGLNADVAAGMRVGLGSPERTRHQVAVRAGDSIEDIAAEWAQNGDAMQAAMGEDPFFGHRLTADLVVHWHDVQHALGVEVDRHDGATICAAHTYASVVTDLLLERIGAVLRVELSDGTRFDPTTVPADVTGPRLVLRTTPFHYLRTATGRRSRQEVLALDWSGDPEAIVDQLSPYGPPPEDDRGF